MNKKNIYPLWFLIVPLFLYTIFCLLPSILGLCYSFTDWNVRTIDNLKFVGFENYKEIFMSDSNYLFGISNTLKFTVISNVLKLGIGLFLAIMLQEGLKGCNFYRTFLFLPSILPFVIIGIIFKSIFNYNNGLLNSILEFLNLGILKQKWLSDLNIVWKSVYAVDAWRGIGYVMTIFLAGLNTIPKSYYEAAVIDGANFWQKLRYITLPMLVGAITINLIFGLTYGLKVFDIIYVLTNGGPAHATEVISTYVYKFYGEGRYSLSVALNSILFITSLIIGICIIKYMGKKEIQK